ncbi:MULTISPECIES: MFS transporter [unclassified Cupriavidus]|uniref:MFS transporter n=1 Tax=unclassified Cupriavidus TaxID=2640874 RepID=UPI00295F266A|nr:MFS transporter [Cupriavidus sp. TA19]
MPDEITLVQVDGATTTKVEQSSIFSPRYRMATIGIVSLVALIAFEALAVTTAMPAVADALGGMSFYAFAFGITLATSVVGMTIAGGWCDSHGPAAPLWSGLGSFLLGVLIAGTAQSMPIFLAGRLIQGLGSGGVSVALYVLVGRQYPDSLRRKVFAAFSTAWFLPSLVGPFLSGVVVEHIGWRWVFLSVPLFAIPAAAMLRPALKNLPGFATIRTNSLQRCFWACGAATGIALLYIGGQAQGMFACALVSLATVLSLTCSWKLLPSGTLVAAQGLPSVIALRGLVFAAFFGSEAFLPLLLTQERGFTVPMAGLVLSSGAVGWCCASWYQGHSRNGWSRHQFLRAGTNTVCFGLATTFSVLWPDIPVSMGILGWVITGMGMGLISANLALLTLSMSPPDQQGTNSSALHLCEAISVATSLSVSGSLFSILFKYSSKEAFLAVFFVVGTMAILATIIVGQIRPLK